MNDDDDNAHDVDDYEGIKDNGKYKDRSIY